MKTILVAYDGSESARRALERAADLCQNGTSVDVVAAEHVLPQVKGAVTIVDPIEAEDCRRALDEAGSLLRERGIGMRLVEGRGDPAKVIVQVAKDAGADLIVIGTHGRGPLGRTLLGSVSTAVVHHAHCDVLVVR